MRQALASPEHMNPGSQESEAERYLLGLFDFEKERDARALAKPYTLERVECALDVLGRPERRFRVAHIAGTKGKGSTAEHLYRLVAQLAGGPVGLFTSPHLVSLRERIRLGEELIPPGDLLEFSRRVLELNRERFAGGLTFFETVLIVALLHFKARGAQLVILETGLGGRLDATNAVEKNLAVLTRIGLDHQELLGNTLELIAGEKAGILKRGVPALALKQLGAVNEVFLRRAREVGCALDFVEPPPAPQEVAPSAWENAHLALAAAARLFPDRIGAWPGAAAVAARTVRGRMDARRWRGQDFYLDAAHNGLSMEMLAGELRKYPGHYLLCFAMAAGRDPRDLLAPLLPVVGEAVFAELPGGRPGVSPHLILKVAKGLKPDIRARVLDESLESWMEKPVSGAVKLITGSFYIVGAALSLIEARPQSSG